MSSAIIPNVSTIDICIEFNIDIDIDDIDIDSDIEYETTAC